MQNYTQADSLMSLKNEIKESLCNHLAVAGIENVISTDATEIWTLLDLPKPDDYDYEFDNDLTIIITTTTIMIMNMLMIILMEQKQILKYKLS